MGIRGSDVSAAAVVRLTGERDLARAECNVLEHIVDLLVEERARLIGQLAGHPNVAPVRPMLPRAEFLAEPERALKLAERHGTVLLHDERGEICGMVSRPNPAAGVPDPAK
jgi:hypothetical protein